MRFPLDPDLREKWIRAVNRDNWTPGRFSSICSNHFEPNCFLANGTRYISLRLGSVPTLHMPIQLDPARKVSTYVHRNISAVPNSSTTNITGPKRKKDLNCLNIKHIDELQLKRSNNNMVFYQSTMQTIQACRICLALDRRLVKLGDTSLKQLYQDITGYSILPTDALQHVCWECTAKLRTCAELRRKAINSHNLLLSIVQSGPITVPTLKSIDRKASRLESTLTTKKYRFNYPDERFGKEKTFEHTDHDYFDPNAFECMDESEIIKTLDESQLLLKVLPMNMIDDGNYNTFVHTQEKKIKLENFHTSDSELESNYPLDAKYSVSSDLKSEVNEQSYVEYLESSPSESQENNQLQSDHMESNESESEEKNPQGLDQISTKESASECDNHIKDEAVVTEYLDVSGSEPEDNNSDSLVAIEPELEIKPLRLEYLDEISLTDSESETNTDCKEYHVIEKETVRGEEVEELPMPKATINRTNQPVFEISPLVKQQKPRRQKKTMINRRDKPVLKKSQTQPDTTMSAEELELERKLLELFNIEKYTTLEERMAAWDKRKSSTLYLDGAFKCENCFLGFDSEERYSRHMFRHTDESGLFECVICKYRFKKKKYLTKHGPQHFQKYYCKKCKFNTSSKKAAKFHVAFHEGKVYECRDCNLIIHNPSTYQHHLRAKHCNHNCTSCGECFMTELGLSRHKRKRNHYGTVPLSGPYCDLCEVRFESQQAMNEHLSLSSKHKPSRVAASVTYSTTTVKRPRYHKMTSRRMKFVYVCVKCGFSFMTEHGFNYHYTKLHEDPQREDGPVCSVCDLRFNSDKAMDTHLKVSHMKTYLMENKRSCGYKRYTPGDMIKCELCDVEVATPRLYTTHFLISHPGRIRTKYLSNRPYLCDQCGKLFVSLSELEDHKFEHLDNIHFECPECGKLLKSERSLRIHAQSHDSGKNFTCDICGKSFNRLGNMQKHQVSHKGLKKFQCHICGKKFHHNFLKTVHVKYVHMKVPLPKRLRRRRTVKAPKTQTEQTSNDQQLAED